MWGLAGVYVGPNGAFELVASLELLSVFPLAVMCNHFMGDFVSCTHPLCSSLLRWLKFGMGVCPSRGRANTAVNLNLSTFLGDFSFQLSHSPCQGCDEAAQPEADFVDCSSEPSSDSSAEVPLTSPAGGPAADSGASPPRPAPPPASSEDGDEHKIRRAWEAGFNGGRKVHGEIARVPRTLGARDPPRVYVVLRDKYGFLGPWTFTTWWGETSASAAVGSWKLVRGSLQFVQDAGSVHHSWGSKAEGTAYIRGYNAFLSDRQ